MCPNEKIDKSPQDPKDKKDVKRDLVIPEFNVRNWRDWFEKIEWNIKIQNALVKADKISGFNWDDLEFSDDINVLNNNNIIVKIF